MTLPVSLGDRLGTLRCWQNFGEPYAQMLREAAKPALGLTFVSSYMGAAPAIAALIGLAVAVGLVALSIAIGWAVARYRVIHRQVETERDNNPVTLRTLELLEEIARNTRRPVGSYERVR